MAVSSSDLNFETPLLKYAVTAIKNGGIMKGSDLRMPPGSSMRLAIGMDDQHQIYLGVQAGSTEVIVFESFQIAEVAFARQTAGRDWLVISTADASAGRGKTKDGRLPRQIPMRLWYPVNNHLFDGFGGLRDDRHILFTEMRFVNGHPESSGEDVLFEAPLKLRGIWNDVEVIEDEVPEIIPETPTQKVKPSGNDDILANEDIITEEVEIPDDLDIGDLLPDDL